MTITGRFIVRDKENPHKFCEFFISEGKDLAMLWNNGMEILSVNAVCQESINANPQEDFQVQTYMDEEAIRGYRWDKPDTYAPEESGE